MDTLDKNTVKIIKTKIETIYNKFAYDLNRNSEGGNPCIFEQGQVDGAKQCLNIFGDLLNDGQLKFNNDWGF